MIGVVAVTQLILEGSHILMSMHRRMAFPCKPMDVKKSLGVLRECVDLLIKGAHYSRMVLDSTYQEIMKTIRAGPPCLLQVGRSLLHKASCGIHPVSVMPPLAVALERHLHVMLSVVVFRLWFQDVPERVHKSASNSLRNNASRM